MTTSKKTLCVFLASVIACGCFCFSAAGVDIESVINDTAQYLYKNVTAPGIGAIGGEWTVLGLARSGCNIPQEYFQSYYENVEKHLRACNGKLHDKKYTEYSRLILALTSIGKNPSEVAGYNLLMPLGDYEKTIYQGLNGPIWAIIALDSGGYEIPKNPNAKTQATRELYIEKILDCQLPDGGWSLFGSQGASDPDVTGMALQALANYRNKKEVEQAIQKALDCMSRQQNNNGGFSSRGIENSESCVQMIVALCELGIELGDKRFVKNGKTMLDNLLTFYEKGNGFLHSYDKSGSNLMSTEQAFYGLVAAKRVSEGKNSLYKMSDAISIFSYTHSLNEASSCGFFDIQNHKYKNEIAFLAARGIINGKAQGYFEPESKMTRAQLATIITRACGLVKKSPIYFDDVAKEDWFFDYVSIAFANGIIKGVTQNRFEPNSTITREQAATMLTRAASLCGINVQMSKDEIRNTLSQFSDYATIKEWAQGSLAFCIKSKMLDCKAYNINPSQEVTRGEIAYMLFNLLSKA